MPPKQRFTHDIILDKAYEILQAGGMGAVNARSVSQALHCSTQPIFSYFPDMSALRSEIIEKAVQELVSAIEDSSLSNSSFIARCNAYISFANKQPNILKMLFSISEMDLSTILMDISDQTVAAEKESTGLSDDCLHTVFTRLYTYSTGLAIQVISGKLPYDEKHIQDDLESIYKALVRSLNC